ncbi:MAG: hypothetical protein R3E66_13510 [bacterium]
MLDWLSRVFNRKPPHPGERWHERENLTVTVDVATGELRLDDGATVSLGGSRDSLQPFGRPHDAGKYSQDFFQYPKFGLLFTTEDGVIDSISLDLVSGATPQLSVHGTPVDLKAMSTEADVVKLMGEPLYRNDEGFEDFGEIILEYRIREGVFAEWCFEDGRLVDVDFCDYGDDSLHPNAEGTQEPSDDEGVW